MSHETSSSIAHKHCGSSTERRDSRGLPAELYQRLSLLSDKYIHKKAYFPHFLSRCAGELDLIHTIYYSVLSYARFTKEASHSIC